jgi:hypothetical protein
VGRTATASGNQSTVVGYSASATQLNATAVGSSAQALHQNATAIGANATTTAANQVTLGGSGSSVRIGDIAASTLAQSGAVQAVTVDGSGTLGRQSVVAAADYNQTTQRMMAALGTNTQQIDQLSGRIDGLAFDLGIVNKRASAGIAAAMAFGGTMVVPDSNVSISLNAATYRGEEGFSGSIVARVAPRVYVSGGVAGSSAKGSTGGRVGIAFGL